MAGASVQYAHAAGPTFTDANWVSMGTPVRSGVGLREGAAVDAAGNLYVGANYFTNSVGLTISNIAKWNGTDWSALGTGVNGPVRHLLVVDTNLYVAGSFTTAGGIVASNIAKWDGSNWSALGPGRPEAVRDMAMSGDDLHVLTWDGFGIYTLARWDGSSWSTLGSVFDQMQFFERVAVSGSNVYVGGLGYIGRWNPSTGLTDLGGPDFSGFSRVNALAVSGSLLYVAGAFASIGGVAANNVARWNGSTWSALGSGLPSTPGGTPWVTSLAVSGSMLYAGGTFAKAGGTVADGIARWNGSSWSALGAGVGLFPGDPSADKVAASGSTVYAFGSFSRAGTVAVDGVAKWNGSAWSAVVRGGMPPTSVNGAVTTLAGSGTNLYVGGYFDIAGNALARGVARWNGSSWSPLGSGADDAVLCLAASGNNLYAGMWLTVAGQRGSYLARWNGAAWTTLGGAAEDRIDALAVSGTDIYAGGWFWSVNDGAVAAAQVAKWNGSSWSALGSGLDGPALALTMSGTNLYVAGAFTTAGGVSTTNIARWDGATWSALGSGLSGQSPWQAPALAVWNGDLYAGGTFTDAGGVAAPYLARWNGTTWSAVGTGVNGPVGALLVSGNYLYVGGWFTTAGGVPAARIARWDGTNWAAFGSGVNGAVLALAVMGSDLYVGGYFDAAGASFPPTLPGRIWSLHRAAWPIRSRSLPASPPSSSMAIRGINSTCCAHQT